LRRLLKAPAVRLAMQSGLGMVGIQFALISYLMLYLRDIHNIPLARGAWMLFTAQMAGGLGRVTLAAWSDRLSSRLIPVWIAAAAAALGALTLAMLQSEWPFVPLLILSAILGFFAFGWYGPWVVFVAENAPDGAMGLTLALAMTANQLAIVIAPPIFGLLYDLSGGYMLPWSTMAVILAAVAWRTATGLRSMPDTPV
jgi:predicted MFS family arabinose efflux permease